jgi:hypothetical protein
MTETSSKTEQSLKSMLAKTRKAQGLPSLTSKEKQSSKTQKDIIKKASPEITAYWELEADRQNSITRLINKSGLPQDLTAAESNAYLSSIFSCAWLPSRGNSVVAFRRELPNLIVKSSCGELPSGAKVFLPSSLLARRLFLLFSTTAAVQASRVVKIENISSLLRSVGLSVKGSRLKKAQNQLLRLAMTEVEVSSKKSSGDWDNWKTRIFEKVSFGLDEVTDGAQLSFIPNEVVFSEAFYKRAVKDKAQLVKASEVMEQNSSLGHDIALWVLFRRRRLSQPLELSYEQLYHQFATQGSHFYSWKKRFRQRLSTLGQGLSVGLTYDDKSVVLLPLNKEIEAKL